MFLLSWFDLIRKNVNILIDGAEVKDYLTYTKKDDERLKEQNKTFKINTELYLYILDVYQLDLSKRKCKYVNHNFVDASLALNQKKK